MDYRWHWLRRERRLIGSDIIRRSHGIKTDSCNRTEMCWRGRGSLASYTRAKAVDEGESLWLWQLLPCWCCTPAPSPPPCTPSPAHTRQQPCRDESSLYPWRKCGKFSHLMTALCIVTMRLMYLSWITKSTGLGETMRSCLLPRHELNPLYFVLNQSLMLSGSPPRDNLS